MLVFPFLGFSLCAFLLGYLPSGHCRLCRGMMRVGNGPSCFERDAKLWSFHRWKTPQSMARINVSVNPTKAMR